MKTVGIIDYGSGNFGSVWNAVSSLTSEIICVSTAAELNKCSHIILPGVGAFAAAMRKIESLAFINKLLAAINGKQIQFLGICVGMQIMATFGREFEVCKGLNLINGIVEKIDVDTQRFPLPHIGWNSLINCSESPLYDSMENEPTFYFLHSYHVVCKHPDILPIFCEYGTLVTAAFSKDNIHGVQFHPEKSQDNGIKLLNNFLSL